MFPGSDPQKIIGSVLANPHLVLVPGCPCRTAGWTKNHVLSYQSVCVLLGQK